MQILFILICVPQHWENRLNYKLELSEIDKCFCSHVNVIKFTVDFMIKTVFKSIMLSEYYEIV